MVVMIFEGADNLGKSTIINKFISDYKDTRDITMIHSTGPHPEEGEDPFDYQTRAFKDKAIKVTTIGSLERTLNSTSKNIVILDRAWHGEYVYGQIYRNGDPDKIIDMINKNDLIVSNLAKVVVIHLKASPEFILKHDDNKSITSTFEKDKKILSIKREVELFDECFTRVKVPVLDINVEGENYNYRDINEIYKDINDGLRKIKITL